MRLLYVKNRPIKSSLLVLEESANCLWFLELFVFNLVIWYEWPIVQFCTSHEVGFGYMHQYNRVQVWIAESFHISYWHVKAPVLIIRTACLHGFCLKSCVRAFMQCFNHDLCILWLIFLFKKQYAYIYVKEIRVALLWVNPNKVK